MITEDYVSYETAKLLREKGFDEYCTHCYSGGNINITFDLYRGVNVKNSECDDDGGLMPSPTIQTAMKWLREVHNLHIEIVRTACGYMYIISEVPSGTDLYNDFDACDGDDKSSGQWTTYEKACEASIKYCLENFVKMN